MVFNQLIIFGAYSMLLIYWIFLHLVFPNVTIAEYIGIYEENDDDSVISLSTILGQQLIFHANDQIQEENFKACFWYKGISDSRLLISTFDNASTEYSILNRTRYRIADRTDLIIQSIIIGDEGFYTLKIQTNSVSFKQYIYHVIVFAQNLSFFITPLSHQALTYRAEQTINMTCSIVLFADRTFMEQMRYLFSLTWYMIIYNNDPDFHELLSTSTSYVYMSYLYNYELHQDDHNQTLSCALFQQNSKRTLILNMTLTSLFNIEYKAYLYGNYYFTRSFSSHSTIEINCEEFHANPKPLYTLLWMSNGENRTLLNKSTQGRYVIQDATWRHRGNYTCFAENYLNNHQPAHQSFRLNIWFHEHQPVYQYQTKLLSLESSFLFNRNKPVILTLLIIIFVFSCVLFMASLYYYCIQTKSRESRFC